MHCNKAYIVSIFIILFCIFMNRFICALQYEKIILILSLLYQHIIFCNNSLVLQDLAAEDKRATLLGAGLGKQTWSRYLVENYLQHYKWYNPNRDNPDAPSLSKGWAYFEHFTLPRRFESKSGGHHIRAPPGEAKHTKLYSAFMTPQESLSGKVSNII